MTMKQQVATRTQMQQLRVELTECKHLLKRCKDDRIRADASLQASSHESEELQQRIRTLRLQLEEEQALRKTQQASSHESEELQQRIRTLRLQLEEEQALRKTQQASIRETEDK